MQQNEEDKPLINEVPNAETSPAETTSQDVIETIDDETEETSVSEQEINSFSKIQLADKLDVLLTQDGIQQNLPIVRAIKDRFDDLVKEAYQQKLRVFMEDGSLEEDF